MKERRPCSIADPPERLESRKAVSNEEPEKEAQADVEAHVKIKECEEELESRMEAIMALRDVVLQQREVISSLKANRLGLGVPFVDTWRIEAKPASRARTSSSESKSTDEIDLMPRTPFSFDLLHDRTDDEMMSALTCEEDESHESSDVFKVRGHINDVIESIREQASHVDAAIALDELQTTKKELLTATNNLHHRTAEVGELKNQIRSLEVQLSTLELERDLYQADAARSEADLKECIQYILELRENRGSTESHRPDSRATVSTLEISPSSSFATPNKASRHVESNEKNDGAHHCDWSETEAADKQNQERPATCISGWALFPDDSSTSSVSMKSAPRKNLALCFWAQQNREVIDKGPAFETVDNGQPRRLFRGWSTNRKIKSKVKLFPPSGKAAKANSSQRAQIVKLNERLVQASRDAEQLRAQISSATRYYDNIVRSLQQNAGSSKSGRSAFKTDMINKLSTLDREKQATITKLREKEALIAFLQTEVAALQGSLRGGNENLPLQERGDL
jgi:peptidoglycan hydrolase CwlO-like protein